MLARYTSIRELILLLCLCNTGCVAWYSSRPVELSVKDARTGSAAVDVPVRVDYLSMFVLNAPRSVEGKTDQRGLVVLPLADFDNGVILLTVGGSRYTLDKDLVRNGGMSSWISGSNAKESPFAVTLTPQKRSLWQWIMRE